MIGQGRPSSRISSALRAHWTIANAVSRLIRLRGRLLFSHPVLLAAAIVLATAQFAAGQPTASGTPAARASRIRIAWGGGSEQRRWTGQVTIRDGSFGEMQLLGMEAD